MNKLEKQEIIYKACESIELGIYGVSCYAMEQTNHELSSEYREFLDLSMSMWVMEWQSSDIAKCFYFNNKSDHAKSTRILTMLLFLEASDSVLGEVK